MGLFERRLHLLAYQGTEDSLNCCHNFLEIFCLLYNKALLVTKIVQKYLTKSARNWSTNWNVFTFHVFVFYSTPNNLIIAVSDLESFSPCVGIFNSFCLHSCYFTRFSSKDLKVCILYGYNNWSMKNKKFKNEWK